MEEINYEALSIYYGFLDELKEYSEKTGQKSNARIENIVEYSKLSLAKLYSSAGEFEIEDEDVFALNYTDVEEDSMTPIRKTNFYKSYFDKEKNKYIIKKIAYIDKDGNVILSDEYLKMLKQIYKNYNGEIIPMSIEELDAQLLDDERIVEAIPREQLEAEAKVISKEQAFKGFQEERKKKEIERKTGVKSKPVNEQEAKKKIENKVGVQISASTVIKTKEEVAEGKTFGSVLGIDVDKYDDCYPIFIGGKYQFWAINKETGEPEFIKGQTGKTQGEKNIALMNETGSKIEKKQTRAIFDVDKNQALAMNVEATGKMSVYYLKRGNDMREYLGVPVSSNKQERTTGSVKRFVGVELENREKKNEAIDEAYHQLEETSETNKSLIDSNTANDVIYYDANEIIKMEDGTETTIAQEATNSEMGLQIYIQELEKMDGKCLSDKIVNMRVHVIEEKEHEAEEQEKEHVGREERLTPEEEALMRQATKQIIDTMNENGGQGG